MSTERFIADKATIRADLERRARARQTITYGEAAALVKRTARGLGAILTAIRVEEAGRGRPDLSALVVRVSTGMPSYVRADPADRARAIAVQEAVWRAWAEPG
jgi:hypothetical protein